VDPSDRAEQLGVGEDADTAGRLPNLIIAGVSKGGTTSLFSYLGQHPDICGSDIKELRYFAPLRHGGELGPIEEYAHHFRHCTGYRYAVEATPGYYYGGRPMARGLQDVCPDVHVLVSLRAPDERCWSWFRFVKSRLRIPKDMSFDAYLDRCEELHRAGVDGDLEHQAFWGLGGGCYDVWFDSWVEELGERFRVVFFEDVARDPAGVVRDICRWLRLDEGVVDEFTFPVENRTEPYRAAGLQRVAVAFNRRGEQFFRRHRTAKRLIRSAYYAVNRQPSSEELPPAARARLAEFYRPHNARLAEQLSSAAVEPPTWLRNQERRTDLGPAVTPPR
jgi:hypothetical protein